MESRRISKEVEQEEVRLKEKEEKEEKQPMERVLVRRVSMKSKERDVGMEVRGLGDLRRMNLKLLQTPKIERDRKDREKLEKRTSSKKEIPALVKRLMSIIDKE